MPNNASSSGPPPVTIGLRPATPHFTGRWQILRKLEAFFALRQGGSCPRREYVLYGMGGAGKSQIALKFAEENQKRCVQTAELLTKREITPGRFDYIFWLDASRRDTIEQGYKDIAAECCAEASEKGNAVESALRWLGSIDREWLLLLDNADDRNILSVLSSLLPKGHRGNIIYTSRNSEMRIGLPRNASCEVDTMDAKEAITLLIKCAYLDEDSEESKRLAKPIVEELGSLALAIDQAGAYIATGQCRLDDYLRIFHNHRKELLQNSSH